MKSICVLLFSCVCMIGRSQEFSNSYESTIGIDPFIRDVKLLSSGNLAVAFDYQLDTLSAPVSGVMLLDELGNLIWSKILNIPDSDGSCSFEVEESSSGEILLFGLTNNNTSLSMNGFFVNISSSGLVNSYREYPSDLGASGYAVNNMSVLPSNEVLLLVNIFNQSMLLKTDVNGDIIWGRTGTSDTLGVGKSPGYDALALSGGEIICTGKDESMFTQIKFDNNGNILWMRNQYIGPYVQIRSLTEADNGRLFATGATEGNPGLPTTPLLIEIDPINGDILWIKEINYSYGSYFGIEFLIDDGDGLIMSFSSYKESILNAPPSDSSHLVKFDYEGNIVSTTQLASGYVLVDYPAFDKFGHQDYVYSAMVTDGVDTFNVMNRTTDIMKVNCLRESDQNFTSTIWTDFGDTTINLITSIYDTIISPVVSTSDLGLSKNEYCADIGFEEQEIPSIQSYYNSSDQYIYYLNTKELEYETFAVSDISGKTLINGNLKEQGQISVTGLKRGVYIFTAYGSSNKCTLKFEIIY